MDPTLIVVAVAGLVAGFVNTLAGGGSALTLPALMLTGMPADVANGTNRLAVGAQSIAGTIAFSRQGKLPWPLLLMTLAPTTAGALLGALAAARWVPREWLKPVLLGTMLVLSVTMLLKPRAWGEQQEPPLSIKQRPSALLGLFFAGLYGGFVQAGVGFVLLAVVAGMLRHNLVESNAVKLASVFFFNLAALAVFLWAGQIEWMTGALLAVSTVIGSLLGVRYATKAPAPVLRKIVFAAILASTLAAAWR